MHHRMRIGVIVSILVLLVSISQAGVSTWTFTNPDMISFNCQWAGRSIDTSPYPSTIHIPALPGVIKDIAVSLNGPYCRSEMELNVKLTAPWSTYYKGGVSLMGDINRDSQIGTGTSSSPILTLTDSASNYIPTDRAPTTGTYKPTTTYNPRSFPAPCPNLTYYKSFTEAGILSKMFPVGNWNLWCFDSYIADNLALLYGGWSLTLTMEYCGIDIPAGNLVAVQNELVQGTPGYTKGLISTSNGGTFGSDFYQVSPESLQEKIDAGIALFDSIPLVPTTDVQYWNVAFWGDNSEIIGDTELTFEYDPSTLLNGISENNLGIWHFTGEEWEFLGGQVNTAQNTITIVTDSFSPFVLGVSAVPEPMTLFVLGVGGVMVLRRKRM